MTNLIPILQRYGIKGVAIDSKKIIKNSVFFAIKGASRDGNHYIGDAFQNGASLAITDDPNVTGDNIIYVEDARRALAEALRLLHNNHPQYLTAVTGTNGKTSIAHYFYQICEMLGYAAASIGTIGITCKDDGLRQIVNTIGEILTTPDIITMYKVLEQCALHNVSHVCFEASSHGLDQKRAYGIPVVAAAFTNLTQDHLDYHKTLDRYKAAKLLLFSENLIPEGVAVVSTELEKDVRRVYSGKVITIGDGGDLEITSAAPSIREQNIQLRYRAKKYSFKTEIMGSFQATNILFAALLAEACGMDFDDIIAVVPQLCAAPGRLQRVTEMHHPLHVFVDYAHTPDALEKSLIELSLLKASGRLFVVFGCGGDRDKSKRQIMGAVAHKIADVAIITDDNPRTEDAALIRADIAKSAPSAVEIPGRKEAIHYALKRMRLGDILLIAGKGHEDYQIIGTTKTSFDDVVVTRSLL